MSATSGVLSGIIPTEALVVAGRAFVRALPPPRGCLPDAVLEYDVDIGIRQASDILMDGSIDPQRLCDGISLGLGFDAARVTLGPAVVVTQAPNQCPVQDGGAD